MYVCAGFWVVAVVPSPKFHSHEVGAPVEVSVNWTGSRTCTLVADAVNDDVGATGAGVTVIVVRFVRSPPSTGIA